MLSNKQLKLLNNNSTTNLDLIDIAKTLNIDLDVLPKDKLPEFPQKKSYIINMADSKDRGTHWVALYFTKDCAFYFDSYGMEPPLSIINFMLKKKYQFFSDKIIQGLNEGGCGSYCILFLYHMNTVPKNSNSKCYITKFNEFSNSFRAI